MKQATKQSAKSALSKEDKRFLDLRADNIREAGKRTVEGIVLIGQWLTECKHRLHHGEWLPWLKREFGWTEMTALRFMRVYEFSKSNNLLDMEINISALHVLAAPKTPEPIREEAIRRAQSGERITRSTTLQLVKSHQMSTPVVITPDLTEDTAYAVRMRNEEQQRLKQQETDVRNIYASIELLANSPLTPEEMIKLTEKFNIRNLQSSSKRAWFWLNQIIGKETIQ